MFKKSLLFCLITLYFSITFAQTPYFQSQKTTNSSLPAASKTILSPADFSKKISKTTSENQAAFKQKLDQKISQIPPPKVQTPPSSAFGKSNPPKEPVFKKNTSTQTETTSQEPEVTQTETQTVTTETPPKPVAPKPAAPAPTTTTSPSAAPNSQPYTGFGTQTPQQSPQNNNSGGWNVRY